MQQTALMAFFEEQWAAMEMWDEDPDFIPFIPAAVVYHPWWYMILEDRGIVLEPLFEWEPAHPMEDEYSSDEGYSSS